MALTLSFGVDEYTLANGSDESDPAEYGDPVIIESGGNTYIALVEETDAGDRISLLGDDWVFKGRMVKCGFDEYDEVADEMEEGDGPDEGTLSGSAADSDDDDAGDDSDSDSDDPDED
jgi:hypothetical protein